ncbi:diphthine--ammonia ligase [Candidatus Woesearchaeota archaeon]|nr:diphthine--ammonia ligase [Candidatus Woesearchaeota archaeon]
MCGIIGVFNDPESVSQAAKALDVIQNRGRDGRGIAAAGTVNHAKDPAGLRKKTSGVKSADVIGHVLHSIVGNVPQPLKGKGILVANCEIYNWKQLDAENKLGARNDSEVVLKLVDKLGVGKLRQALEMLDGPYAFAYWLGDKVYVCRDLLGEKPVWYSENAFCSERKALEAIGIHDSKELNPREILAYDLKSRKLATVSREFLTTKPVLRESEEQIRRKLTGILVNAVAKRVPDQKFGILFSGGVDSTLIAQVCKSLGVGFTCYTAALESETEAEDLAYAKKAAAELGVELKFKTINLGEVETYLKKVVPLIEDNNVVKVGVGLTFYVACEMARKDGIKVIFSGLGSEELFAGYERHKDASDVNDECLSGLRKMYERDTYRDDVITMNNNLELRLPFLDIPLVKYALKIPAKYKLDALQNKKILRSVAEELGVPKVFAQRKKKAAQYGSGFDKALEKLARKAGMKSKSAYLDRFYSRNPVLGVMFSGGKDSAYALWVMMKQNYPVRCLISMQSSNPDSYMFHTPNIDLVGLQAKAMQIPVVVGKTAGEKEKELADLKSTIERAKREYGIEGVVTGALYSQYQRERIEKICDSLGLKIFSPLWHMDQEKEMRQLISEGFEFVFSSVAAEGLDKSWLGRRITAADVDKLVLLKKKVGLNVAGEGGEFESLVLDGPCFRRRIEITDSLVVEENEVTARFAVKKAKLVNK